MAEKENKTLSRVVLSKAKRIVVKVGSAVLAREEGLNIDVVRDLSAQLAALKKQGRQITLVSSGAVAAGSGRLPEHASPRSILEKQALAAVGQGQLMHAYEEAFKDFDIQVAQILLTRDGLIARERYLNAKNTLNTLLQWGIMPIVNENDTVATEELQFTDNDQLAALMVNLVDAELLICLSDIDGLYDKDPGEYSDTRRIPDVIDVDEGILDLATDKPGRAGRGGMRSKLLSARLVTACGVPMVVAGGRTPQVLERLFSGEELGTFFHSYGKKIYGKKPWIAFTLVREGRLILDDGAVRAIKSRGKSLLPVGVKEVVGNFDPGACVNCCDKSGKEIAAGISNYGSSELRRILGCKTDEIRAQIGYLKKNEVIHRDNMVIF